MFLRGWGEGGGAWQWRRRLWVWEEELLKECRLLLLNVSLQPLSYDVWQWLPDPSGGYFVPSVYAMLTTQQVLQVSQDVDLIWHKQVPQRCLFLLGGCFVNAFLQNQIWHYVVLLMQRRHCMLRDAARWMMLVTCFCHALDLGLCGPQCGRGSVINFQQVY